MTERLVVVVAYDGVQLLDLVGPADVFDAASRGLRGEEGAILAGDGVEPATGPAAGYRVVVASRAGTAVRASNGIRIVADARLAAIDGADVDTLVVCGSPFMAEPLADEELLAELRRIAPRARRTTSVCSGAFLLASAGLLDGRVATTHWAGCGELARRFPDVTVEPDRIYVRDGDVATSAGVTAGIDLALALVEEDHGAALALRVARWLVMFLQRPGGQSQFSERLALPPGMGSPIRAVVDAIAADPGGAHRIGDLAQRAALSERHFARVFVRETGLTPARFIERVRVEAAREALERTPTSLDAIAAATGFGSTETMRRAFLRVLGVGPGAYRARFRTTGPTPMEVLSA